MRLINLLLLLEMSFFSLCFIMTVLKLEIKSAVITFHKYNVDIKLQLLLHVKL